MVTDAFQKPKTVIESACGEIIKKYPANAPRFVAMFEKEIIVAPCFQALMQPLSETLTRTGCGSMPVHRIVNKSIVWRQIKPATKPPLGSVDMYEAHIHMSRGHIRIQRMCNDGYPHR